MHMSHSVHDFYMRRLFEHDLACDVLDFIEIIEPTSTGVTMRSLAVGTGRILSERRAFKRGQSTKFTVIRNVVEGYWNQRRAIFSQRQTYYLD